MLQGIRRRLTFSNVVALLALFFALGSSSAAEPVRNSALQLIGGEDIRSNAVTSRHVRDGSLRSADVHANTLRPRDLRAGVAATDVLGTARVARRASAGRSPARASQASGICNAIGQVVLFGGRFAPAGTVPARGQLLPLPQAREVFAVYGTRFGGDGQTSVGVPDLSGAEPKGQGGEPLAYLVCVQGSLPTPP